MNARRLEDLLDVPSYGEPLGEAILQRMRKLESKRRRFPPLQNRYGHGRTGRTIAAGPGVSYYTFALLTASLFFNQPESYSTLSVSYYTFLHCLLVQEKHVATLFGIYCTVVNGA